jgi:drug/metabolite transporter (DMT)-like permease
MTDILTSSLKHPSQHRKVKALFDLIFMYVIMAGVYTFGKQALLHSDPFFLTAVRYIPSGLVFIAAAYFLNKKEFVFKPKTMPLFIGISFFYFLMDALRLVSLKQIPSSHAALMSVLSPFVAALIAFSFFKEKFPLKKCFALFLGFFGVLPLIIDNILHSPATYSSYNLLSGYVAMFMSVIAAVVATFLYKKLLASYSIYLILGVAVFFGGIMSLFVSLLAETWNPVPVNNVILVAPVILFIFITHNLIAQPLYGYLVKKYPVTLVTFATLITPVTSAALGYFVYGQAIGTIFFFSLITLMIAFFLFYQEEEKEGLIR